MRNTSDPFYLNAPAIRCIFTLIVGCGIFFASFAQETNSNVSGRVRRSGGEVLRGASVKLVHLPTQSMYQTQTNEKGFFHFFNLKPGGPYQLVISSIGFRTVEQRELFVNINSEVFYTPLHDQELREFILTEQPLDLPDILIRKKLTNDHAIGAETAVSPALMKDAPSISRNLQDYVRFVPQAKVTGNGSMSFAGQNNRFNAFFIDGSPTQDLLGVASSGINGGQSSSPPISVDAIEEINILVSPFEAQYGNFTGASINAITRSGSNQSKSAAWYYFRNEKMAGRSPTNDAATARTRLSSFFNQTIGAWNSGAIVKNKVFHFVSLEWQKEDQPQPYDLSSYKGNSNGQQLNVFANILRNKYGYDPGIFNETKNKLRAIRFLGKVDWNLSEVHKLTFTYRLNDAARQTPQTLNGSTVIRFSNNGYNIAVATHSGTFEWRSFLKKKMSNRMLISYTDQKDDRQILGSPFPGISIADGAGTIFAGSNNSAQVSFFRGKDLSILDVFKLEKGRHVFSFGADFNFTSLNDLQLSAHYGLYQYRNLNDFISNNYAVRFQRGLLKSDQPADDHSTAGARYRTSRTSFFAQQEIRFSERVNMRMGIRLDGNGIRSSYAADMYFNSIAVPAIQPYYDLQGAVSGSPPNVHWQISPRIELNARFKGKVMVKLGAGLFTGHILNIWASEIYNVGQSNLDLSPANYGLLFNPDVNSQPGFVALGIDPEKSKGNVNLVSENFKYPTLLRLLTSVGKDLGKGWSTSLELLFSKNIHEVKYSNVNLMPPVLTSATPGSRSVYSTGAVADRISMPGGNPYNAIYLLANSGVKKGYAYNVTAILHKQFNANFSLNGVYGFGHAVSLFEASGPSQGQWRQTESVNGRNNLVNSASDYSAGHRYYIYGSKKFIYGEKKMSTTISMYYQGQSGQRFSYVYSGSMVNDNGRLENYDLIYIPTINELEQMRFLPALVSGVSYNELQQRELLDQFIESDKYLSGNRGKFAERNASRLPFVHSIDLKIQQELMLRVGQKKVKTGIILDIFNLANLLNRSWGAIYALPFDNFPLIRFAGYSGGTTNPQYQFVPISGKPWTLQTSTAPGNSARWICQLGVRFNLE